MYKLKQVVAWILCLAMIGGLVGCKEDSPAKIDVQLPDTFMPEDISISEEDVVYEDNTLYADSQILLTVQSGTTYETVEKLVQEQTSESILERLVKQDLSFDPARRYFDIQTFDFREPNPQWKIVTAEEWVRSEQGTRRPLAEQAEEIHPRKTEDDE